jgi:hypothetical protein
VEIVNFVQKFISVAFSHLPALSNDDVDLGFVVGAHLSKKT